MNDHETPFEKNLHRLMRASVGPDTRPSPELREKLRQRLAAQVRTRATPAEFPAPALAIFSVAALLVATVCFLARFDSKATTDLTALAPLALLAGANYLCLPIACLVIIFRRKHA